MVGHLLQYHPGVNKLKEIADSGELGDIHYIYGNRLNLGQLRAEENALWSLGAHDVSVLLHLADEEPYELNARGESYMREGVEDVVFAFMRFPSGIAAHLHLSWLDPHKERRFTVVGSQRMATFDDMDPERKVTVYDKGFDEKADTYGEYITRSGDIWSPRVPNDEPLRLECEHFVACVREGRTPISDGASGLRGRARARGPAAVARRDPPGRRRPRRGLRGGGDAASVEQGARADPVRRRDRSATGCCSGRTCSSRRARGSARRRSSRAAALLGKVPRLARTSATPAEHLPPLRLGVRVTVCAGAIVYAGSRDRRRGDHRRPGAGARALGDRPADRRRPRLGDRQRRDDRRAGEDPDATST